MPEDGKPFQRDFSLYVKEAAKVGDKIGGATILYLKRDRDSSGQDFTRVTVRKCGKEYFGHAYAVEDGPTETDFFEIPRPTPFHLEIPMVA